jgi:2-aminoadipate transaminase
MAEASTVLKEAQITSASWALNNSLSVLQEALQMAVQPGMLSLGLGLPSDNSFPMEAMKKAAASVFEQAPAVLQYSPPALNLKSQIQEVMRLRGVECEIGQIFLTSGAQQALHLLTRLLVREGSPILMEEITYTGLLHAIAVMGVPVVTVPTHWAHGIDVRAVEKTFENRQRPSFLYLMPEGHNPLGVSLAADRRIRLVELARHFQIPIIEDDPYGLLQYGNDPPPALRSMERDWIIYVGTFSKVFAPALRVGWIVCPEHLIRPLSILKEALDANVTTIGQRIVNACLEQQPLVDHLDGLRRTYRSCRDALVAALQSHFPPDARFTCPRSGIFLWVELGPEVDTTVLLRRAVQECRVSFIPGEACAPDPRKGRNCLRLNFSYCQPEEIERGVRLLADVREAAPTRVASLLFSVCGRRRVYFSKLGFGITR